MELCTKACRRPRSTSTIVTDSEGNIYAFENIGGRRNQKFVKVSG